MIAISIIVPVYNVELYLDRCLKTLVNQTLENIEIIVVNDASPDKSDIIMKQYEKKYPNKIKCIYLKENLSQGGARNQGIKISTGEYITFVDSDDYVDITMCEQMYNKAKETDSDIVFCDTYRIFEEVNEKRYSSLTYLQQMGKMTKEKREQLFLTESYPWAKIIRRNIIINNELWFPEHIKYEDCATVNLYYGYAENCAYIRKPLYFYRLHKNSTTFNKKEKQNIECMYASKILYKRMKKRGFCNIYTDAANMAVIKGQLRSLGMSQAWENPNLEEIYNMAQELKNEFPNMKKNKFYNLDYDIDTWKGKYILEQSYCSYEEFLNKYNSGKLSFENVGYKVYYTKYQEKIEFLFSYLGAKNIALWGAGKKGIDFLEVCDKKRKLIYVVIDKNENKWGQNLETGHKIVNFQEYMLNLDIILVVNYAYFGDIYKCVREQNKDIFIINLDAYIALGNKENIEDFIER